jgi:hypothetical protein
MLFDPKRPDDASSSASSNLPTADDKGHLEEAVNFVAASDESGGEHQMLGGFGTDLIEV